MEYAWVVQNMKDLLIVVSSLGLGGNERSTINIYHSIKKELTAKIVTLDGSQCHNTDVLQEDYYDLKTPAAKSLVIRYIHSIQRYFRFRAIIRHEKPKAVYLILNEGNILTKARYKGTKKIIACRDCGNLIRNHPIFHHNLLKSDYLIFNSRYMHDYYLNQYPDDFKKIKYIYNAIDIQTIERQSKQSLPEDVIPFFSDHKVIVSVGRFCKEKGFNHLVKAFEYAKESVPELGLCIVGDGDLMPEIKELVTESKWSKDILLTGFQNNPYKFIKHAFVYVLSSISEGFPNVILEAIALKIPVISTDCKSGPHEVLDPDNEEYIKSDGTFQLSKYGILCPPFVERDNAYVSDSLHQEKEMAKAITSLLNIESVYNGYVEKSRDAIQPFLLENIGKAYINFFNEIE